MYGLEAIQAYNGWAMALTGAVIVMTGLAILSFIISQIYRVVGLVESLKNRKSRKAEALEEQSVSESRPACSPLSDLVKTSNRFMALTKKIGEPFDLAALFQLFIQYDDPHPHLTIRSLREQGYLIPDGSGLFMWKQH